MYSHGLFIFCISLAVTVAECACTLFGPSRLSCHRALKVNKTNTQQNIIDKMFTSNFTMQKNSMEEEKYTMDKTEEVYARYFEDNGNIVESVILKKDCHWALLFIEETLGRMKKRRMLQQESV